MLYIITCNPHFLSSESFWLQICMILAVILCVCVSVCARVGPDVEVAFESHVECG